MPIEPSVTEIATARAEWVAAGLDGAAFDRAAAPDLRADAGSHVPAASGDVHPDQAAGMVEGLLAGGVSRDAVKAALASDGFDDAAIARMMPDAAPGSADLQAFDQTFAAARPDQYGPGLIPYSVAAIVGDRMNEAHAEWAANLSAMGIPAAAGPAIVEAALQQGQRWATMGPEDRQMAAVRLDSDLIATFGDEAAARAAVEAAKTALAKATPEFRSQVTANGGLLSADVIVTLALASKHQATRTQLQAGRTLGQTTQ